MATDSTPTPRGSRFFDDSSRHVDKFGLLLVLCVVTVTVTMLVNLADPTQSSFNEIGWVFVSLAGGATLIVAASASGVSRRWRRVITVVVSLVVASAIVVSLLDAVSGNTSATTGQPAGAWVLVSLAAPVFVLRRIFRHSRVTAQTLFGALSVYLLVALAFSYSFGALDQYGATVFGSEGPTTQYMYFSMVTITTLGYGDLAPVGTLARYLATSEALIGQVFLVTVVARIVALAGAGTLAVGQHRDGHLFESGDE